jgi:primosomal protein N' (replication factor Y)
MGKRQQELFATDAPPWEIDAAAERTVASVVFPETPYGPFDYAVPEQLRARAAPGRRLRVPLGKANRSVVGYCVRLECRPSVRQELKDVLGVVDVTDLVPPVLLQLTEWMADYYLCPWGQVLEAVVPAGVRGRAGTREVTYLSVPIHVAAKLTQLKLPPKQAQALKTLAAAPRPLTPSELATAADCGPGPIERLREHGLIASETRREHEARGPQRRELPTLPWALNHDQQQALASILAAIRDGRQETFLMHGVTGSGKTEVYIQAIQEVLRGGRQAIVLVPEISLTPQTCERFRSRFAHVAVLHSHLSDAERHWHWHQITQGRIEVVVGARSAVFAPTPRLGMIVLDEEHDGSFKQDNAPRYHAREVALWRTRREQVPLVLGSATPALESWQRAQDGHYRLLELPRRVLDRPLPDVATIDLRTEFQERRSRGAVSRQLHIAIAEALREGGQVILLLNRRGYSTSIQCPACGHVIRCRDCDIALTHHREANKAVCHYCDFTIVPPSQCPECGCHEIRYAGLGTQRLEQEIRSRFRDVECLRMDSDTMQRPGSHEQALARFRSGEVKILLGTQMIAKGLDFPNVTVVGVINADTALHFPDFRAAERTFQLVTQVAGRTGRGDRGGRVLVQTFSPEHPAIQAAIRHDYAAFARSELPVRREFGYPPFAATIRLIVRGPQESAVEQFAERLAERLRSGAASLVPAVRVVGPAPCPIAKLFGKFRWHALVQGQDRDQMRAIVRQATADIKPPAETQWAVDVDPLDLL